MKAYILCGLVGSGKSTWAREKAMQDDMTAVIINRDSIRTMVKGQYIYDSKIEPTIRDMARACVKEAFKRQHDIIIDETNITKVKRLEWIMLLRELESKWRSIDLILVYFNEHTRNLDLRMREPRGQSAQEWQGVIEQMKKDFEEPNIDEGFDKTEFVQIP